MREKLNIGLPRLSAALGLLGTNLKGLTLLSEKSIEKLKKKFGGNDLSVHLLTKEDLKLLTKQDAAKLLTFNKNVVIGIFSTSHNEVLSQLQEKGLDVKTFGSKALSAQDYKEASVFIEHVKSIRKTYLKQKLDNLFVQLATLNFKNVNDVNIWIIEVSEFFKTLCRQAP